LLCLGEYGARDARGPVVVHLTGWGDMVLNLNDPPRNYLKGGIVSDAVTGGYVATSEEL